MSILKAELFLPVGSRRCIGISADGRLPVCFISLIEWTLCDWRIPELRINTGTGVRRLSTHLRSQVARSEGLSEVCLTAWHDDHSPISFLNPLSVLRLCM